MRIIYLSLVFALSISSAWAQSFQKYVLLEEFSTAPCGFCPDGAYVTKDIVAQHPTVVPFTHHAGFGTDSLTIPASITIAADFVSGAPSATIDRCDCYVPGFTHPNKIGLSRQKWDSVAVERLNDPALVNLEITNNYDPDTREFSCTIEVQVSEDSVPVSGDLRLSILLVEDSVQGFGPGFDQTNYYNTTSSHPLYQAGDPIVGYYHSHVVRAMPLGPWGETASIPGILLAGESYHYDLAPMKLHPSWDVERMEVIAFVGYYNSNSFQRQVLNTQHKHLLDTLATPQPNGLEEPSTNLSTANLMTFPNPMSQTGVIQFELHETASIRLELFDRMGKQVATLKDGEYAKGMHYHYLSVDGFANGVYLVRLTVEGRSVVGKVVVFR